MPADIFGYALLGMGVLVGGSLAFLAATYARGDSKLDQLRKESKQRRLAKLKKAQLISPSHRKI